MTSATGWPEVGLGEVCEFKYGKSLPAARREPGAFPVYGSNGVVGEHSEGLTSGPTIIVGRKGSFGEVNYSDSACWPIDTTYFVDATATKADLRWLAHLLPTLRLTELNRAAAVPGLNREDAYRRRCLLPPLEEQRRIAAILDQADGLRATRREALVHFDDLTESIFLDMFGDALRATKWPTLQLQEAVKEGTLVTYGIVQAGDEYPEGIPYIRTGDISNGQIDVARLRRTDPQIARRFDRSRVETGDIVMSIRATVGTTAMVPHEIDGANLTQGTARIAPGARTLGVYLLHYLRSLDVQRWIQRQVKGATFLEITLSRLRELGVAVPPLDQQERFALRVAAVDSLAAQSSAQGQALDSLFASLQSRAFTGEL